MEDFGQYIGYIVFILVFVLPRILGALKKMRSPSGKPLEVPTLEEMIQGQVLTVEDDAEEDTAHLDGQIDELANEANALLGQVAELERQVRSRGEWVAKMGPIIESNLRRPLQKTVSHLRLMQDGTNRTEHRIYQLQSTLSRLTKGLDIATMMVDQRIAPATADLLDTLDVAAKDCAMPYMVHARRLNIEYPTHFALTVARETGFDAANALPSVAPLVVDQKIADLPRSWVQLVSDISLDVYHSTPGLARKLTMDLGTMPPPLSLSHYGNTRALVQGLAGAWLPRLFADVGAAMQLGPAFVSGLNANVGAGLDEQRAVLATIGHSEETPPMYVRMFTALRAIAHMGFSERSKESWESWRRRLDYPKALTLRDREGQTAVLPTAAALDIVARVVDYLVKEPLAPLGGYPLASLPQLRCDRACMTRMETVAKSLMKGQPVNAPGRILIGAALLAVEKSSTVERRVGDAARKSLKGKGVAAAGPTSAVPGAEVTLANLRHSRDLAARAVALGAALAPRGARLGRR